VPRSTALHAACSRQARPLTAGAPAQAPALATALSDCTSNAGAPLGEPACSISAPFYGALLEPHVADEPAAALVSQELSCAIHLDRGAARRPRLLPLAPIAPEAGP
jgi:hypothetical protein